jgi:hypothetical protein
VVWEPEQQKLVRLNIPFWLLRMTKDRPMRLSGGRNEEGDPIRLRITTGDIERYGPGLILDYRDATGKRVLIWAQ